MNNIPTKYKHFKLRLKERLNIDISYDEIHDLVKNIINSEIQLAFKINDNTEIYMYNYNPLKLNKYCYIVFDTNRRIPLTVYHGYQFHNLIKKLSYE